MTTSSRRRLHRGVAVGLFPPPVTAATANAATSNDADDGLAVIPWAEIMTHRYLADLWVVIDGKVYDMTEFIASGEHPGGEEIPLKYGGRDATEYWHELHGHIESEIAADIESGEGDNTFLEVLPRCIGRTSGHTPVEARVYSSWRERNWAGNVWWPAAAAGQQLVEPASLEELCEVVKNADAVRVLGRGHSFVPLCPVEEGGVMISLNQMSAVLELDETNMTVTVEGGITYSQLVGYLSSEERPYSLANVQSHPGFTVAGTLATASHGSSALDPASGRAWLGGQASLARSCLMVLADGTTRRFSPGDAAWHAAIVNLGCLGVMAEVTLDLVPDHDYELVMYRRLLLSAARVTCSLSTDSDDLTL